MRSTGRGVRVLLVVLLGMVSLAAASARADDLPGFGLPTVAAQALSSPGGEGLAFEVPSGGRAALRIRADYDDASAIGGGLWIFDSEGRLIPPIGVTGLILGPYQLYVSGPQPMEALVDVRNRGTHIWVDLTMPPDLLPPGRYRAAVGSASDGVFRTGAVTLYGTEGVRLTEATVSSHGFFHLQRSFKGTNLVVGNYAGVMLDASVTEEIEGLLFGVLIFDEEARGSVTVRAPDGTQQGRMFIFEGRPPGTYVFEVPRAITYTTPRLWGIDIELPPATS